jgi:DNA polymerase III epsilon subunit family exonuclease
LAQKFQAPKFAKKKYVYADRAIPEPHHPMRPAWLNSKPNEIEVIFFDLETTGGNPLNSEVIEIAAIKFVEGQETDRFSTLIKPKKKIPRISEEITGISNNDVLTAPTIEEKIDEILEFFGESVIISHGVIGDFIFLKHYAKTLRQVELKNYYLCTHLIVGNLLPQLPSKTLSGVAKYFSINSDGAHRALADALLTQNIFWKIYEVCEKTGLHTVEDLLQLQGDNETISRLGSGILHRDFSKLPTTSALVYLVGKNREILYVVATQNARKTLSIKTSLNHEKEFNKLLVYAHDFKVERTSHFLQSLLKEKYELRKLNLPIDPRKYESRDFGYVQLFIPLEIGAFLEENPESSFLKLPVTLKEQVEAIKRLQDKSQQNTFEQENINTQTLDEKISETQKAKITPPGFLHPLYKAKKISSSFKTTKYRLERNQEDSSIVCSGHLQQGIGWCFGPFENHKEVAQLMKDALTLLPVEDETLSVFVKLRNLETIVEHLNGKSKEKIETLSKKLSTLKSYLNPKVREVLKQQKNDLEILEKLGIEFKINYFPATGLAVITNMDFKEIDIYVVVNGVVKKEIKLPVEEGDKVAHPRFFTRLFAPYHDEISNPTNPLYFSEDVCNSIELFSFWIKNKKGEGEWINFSELKDLYQLYPEKLSEN